MILYPVLAGALGLAAVAWAFLAGRAAREERPPAAPEPPAAGWQPSTPAEYSALRAMEDITFSEIDQLGDIAERTFGHL